MNEGGDSDYLRSQRRGFLLCTKQLSRLITLLKLHLRIIKEAHTRDRPYHPQPIMRLILDRILEELQVSELLAIGERLNIRQLGNRIRGEDESVQVGEGGRDGGLDGADAVMGT